MQAIQPPSVPVDYVRRWANDLADDLRYGGNRTGIGALLRHLGAQPLEAGTSQATADFMGSIPLGLLRMIKGGAELSGKPSQTWQGLKDTSGGALQAMTIPGSLIAPEGAEAASAGLSKVGDAAGSAVNAAKRPFSLKPVQEALSNAKGGITQELETRLAGIQGDWHQSVRDLFDSVAKEAGVQPRPAESLRDVAANTAAAVKTKASGMYKQFDQTIGGTRFQTYDEQLSNVRRALKNSAGIDPDADGRLVERINDLEEAKAAALEKAKSAGVDPKLVDRANIAWRQASALEDLSKHIQASTSGLRGDLAQGVKAAPEALSPAKLATRANRMYDTGRLQQALGDSRADDLLRNIERTKQAAQDAAENAAQQSESAVENAARKAANVKLKRYAVASGLASVPGIGLLMHLLSE
jgi:hypothetical protein